MRHYFEWNQKYIKTYDFYKSEYLKKIRLIVIVYLCICIRVIVYFYKDIKQKVINTVW